MCYTEPHTRTLQRVRIDNQPREAEPTMATILMGASAQPLTDGTSATGGAPGSNAAHSSPAGESPTTPSGEPSKTFTQADLDRIVKERLAEAQGRAEKRSAAERKQAEDEALAKNAEWQKLAEQRGTELATAKAQAEAATRYAAALNTQIDAEIAAWPAEVRSLDPGTEALEARLAWVAKSRALAARLASLPTAPRTEAGSGQRATTKPAEGPATGQRYRFQNPGDVSW